MFALLDSYIEPQDGTDIAPAWDRAMASTPLVIIATPGATYHASRPLEVTRRVVLLGWATLFYAALGAFVVRGAASMSLFFGIDTHSTNRPAGADAWLFKSRAWCVLCSAKKFGGDGFRVEADVVHEGTNANSGVLLGCSSTGHTGRAFSWRGGDANAWLALMCTTSGCTGEYAERNGGPFVAGFHDASFLGTRVIACHSGVHQLTDGVHPLGYCFDGNSGAGLMLGCYQEGKDPYSVVRHQNTAIANVALFTADSDGAIVSGRRLRGRWEFSRADAINATLTLGAPTTGAIGEIKVPGEYPYALVREAAPSTRWTIRHANMPQRTVVALNGAAPAIEFPLGFGMGFGSLKRTVSVTADKPTTPGVVGDIALAAHPTDTLDGWRYVNSPAGPGWRAFVWPAGSS